MIKMIKRNLCTKHGELPLEKIMIKDGVPTCSECGMPLLYGNHKVEKEGCKMKEVKVEEKRTGRGKFEVSEEIRSKIIELKKEGKNYSQIYREINKIVVPYKYVKKIVEGKI